MTMTRSFRRRAAVIAVLMVLAPLLSIAISPTAAGATITTYPNEDIKPLDIAVGADGALWFTNTFNTIGRISTGGAFTLYDIDLVFDGGDGIALGSDGAMWFTSITGNAIGRITTSGVVTRFTDPTLSRPYDITAGPDGALWFTNLDGSIGRISTAGVITNYDDPRIIFPAGIAAGPDGALWFTNAKIDTAEGTVGRITTDGAMSFMGDPDIENPQDIIAGPDGAMWFIDTGGYEGSTVVGPSISRITTDGVVTRHSDGRMNALNHLAVAPDGAIWFTNRIVYGSVGRMTLSGSVTINVFGGIHVPGAITAGPDGAMWFTNNRSIGRIVRDCTVLPGTASVVEGDAGTVDLHLPVTLSQPSAVPVIVLWTTRLTPGAPAGQADPGSDFTGAHGWLWFAPGETAKTVTITVKGDTRVEPDEWIVVSFTRPVNAKLGGYAGLGFGRIVNDD